LLGLDPWTIDWVLSELNGIFDDLDHLPVDVTGLSSGHTDGPELDCATSDVLFGIVSIGVGVLGKSIKGFFELSTDVVKLFLVVVGITSGNEVIEGIAGLLLILGLVGLLLGPPLLGIWLEVLIDELCGSSISFQDILLEFLKGGSIEDLVGVWRCGLGGDSGD
jgi:hypothetical protein